METLIPRKDAENLTSDDVLEIHDSTDYTHLLEQVKTYLNKVVLREEEKGLQNRQVCEFPNPVRDDQGSPTKGNPQSPRSNSTGEGKALYRPKKSTEPEAILQIFQRIMCPIFGF